MTQQPYTKPYKNSAELLAYLKNTGFKTQKTDAEIMDILDSINCFYLKRYRWNSDFFDENSRQFLPGHDHFTRLLERYKDDFLLRGHLLSLINIVEDILKSRIIDCFGAISPDFHLKAKYTDVDSPDKCGRFIKGIKSSIENELAQKNFIIVHFQQNYTVQTLPIWKALHCLSLGKVIRMIRLDTANTDEKSVHDNLLKFLQVKFTTHFFNLLDSIRWLRNCCAHFDHIIARSGTYYPNTKNKGRLGIPHMDFIRAEFYRKSNPNQGNPKKGTPVLKDRCFAWYYQVLYTVLERIIKAPLHKAIVNERLSAIERIVEKPTYEHLGFDFNKAKFVL